MDTLAFHDFELRSYTVSKSGREIELVLLLANGASAPLESRIRFVEVAGYRFHHTGAAIITDIDEVGVSAIVAEEADFLRESARRLGLRHWEGNTSQYAAALAGGGVRAWRIHSALGFEGFVLGKSVSGTCVSMAGSAG